MDYSVAKSELEGSGFDSDIAQNSNFIKLTNDNGGAANQINRVKVLLINDILNDSLYDLLVTNLGNDSKINLLTVNPTFNKMRSAVAKLNQGFSSTNFSQRDLPDYYILFNFTPPVKNSTLKNTSGLESVYFQMMACGTIFDKTGKIVFAQCTDDNSEQRFKKEEFGASDNDVIETLMNKNISNIATKINSQIEFKEYEFKIKKVEDYSIMIEDKNETLGIGDTIVTYKKVKSDNNQEYLVPAFEYEVIDSAKGLAKCSYTNQFINNVDKPSKSDIAKSTMIVSSTGAKSYSVDTSDMELEGSNIAIEHLDKLLPAILGSGFKKPLVLDNELVASKADIINNSNMFKGNLIIPENKSDLKIKPQYKITLKKHKVKGFNKIDTYTIFVKVTTSNGSKILSQKALTQDITITLPLKHEDRFLKYELLKAIYPLFATISAQL